jgi:sugar lactone lactonase YvrE
VVVSLIGLASLRQVGSLLSRPECVLATARGELFASDWRGGVAHILPDGRQRLYAGQSADLADGPRPNGIALRRDGSFLFAQLGADQGGIWRLDRAGQIAPVLQAIDGVPLPPTNFVHEDASGPTWFTVSTRLAPRARDYRADAASGFIGVIDAKGPRIVADGLGYTNECLPDPAGKFLYVNETFARRLSRFPLLPGNALGPKQVVAEFGPGIFPDGLAFDSAGCVWIVSVVSNRLIRVCPATGMQTVWLEDVSPEHLDWVEAAYRANAMDRPHLDTPGGTVLRQVSSLAFGGPGLTTGFLGCLLGDSIAAVAMPVAGHPPSHWLY